ISVVSAPLRSLRASDRRSGVRIHQQVGQPEERLPVRSLGTFPATSSIDSRRQGMISAHRTTGGREEGTLMTRTTPLGSTVLVLIVPAACPRERSPPPPGPPTGGDVTSAGPAATAAEVGITIDSSRLPAERRAVFDKMSGNTRLDAALRDQML